MSWHAFTFDGLDAALADAEFAEQMIGSGGSLSQVDAQPGVVTQVNAPLVEKFMGVVGPHIQKAVSAGVAESVTVFHQQHKQKMVIGAVAAGGFAVLALAFLWKMSSRLQECCPARPMSGCCD